MGFDVVRGSECVYVAIDKRASNKNQTLKRIKYTKMTYPHPFHAYGSLRFE